MPTCKNTTKGYYKGTEPSPKGRGYCARAENVGKRMRGTDKRMWVVKSYKVKESHVKRWARVPMKKAAPSAKKKRLTVTSLKGGGAMTKETAHAYHRRFVTKIAALENEKRTATAARKAAIAGELNGLNAMIKHLTTTYKMKLK